jgi:hypothetical protein
LRRQEWVTLSATTGGISPAYYTRRPTLRLDFGAVAQMLSIRCLADIGISRRRRADVRPTRPLWLP